MVAHSSVFQRAAPWCANTGPEIARRPTSTEKISNPLLFIQNPQMGCIGKNSILPAKLCKASRWRDLGTRVPRPCGLCKGGFCSFGSGAHESANRINPGQSHLPV